MYDILKNLGLDEGIVWIIDSVVLSFFFLRIVIVCDVRIFLSFIELYGKIVRKFEKVLVVYLKDFKNLLLVRFFCWFFKKDYLYVSYFKGYKVDVIDYFIECIKLLEFEIKDVW